MTIHTEVVDDNGCYDVIRTEVGGDTACYDDTYGGSRR